MEREHWNGLLYLVICASIFFVLGIALAVYSTESTEPRTCQDFAVPMREAMKVTCSTKHGIEAAEGLFICRCRES